MQTTTGTQVYRSTAVPVRQPSPPGPVAARPDAAQIAQRSLGNDFLQRTADHDDATRTDEGGCAGGCGCGGTCGSGSGAVGRMVQPKLIDEGGCAGGWGCGGNRRGGWVGRAGGRRGG